MNKIFRNIAAASLAVAIMVPSVAFTAVQPAQAAATTVGTGCAKVTVIGARGSGQAQSDRTQAGHLRGFGQQAGFHANDLVRRLSPGTTVRYDQLFYPAVSIDAWAVLSGAYNTSVTQGIAQLKVQVNYFVLRCPSTKIILIGYSQGAEVVHLGAAALPASTASHITMVGLMADPKRNNSDDNLLDFVVGGTARYNGADGAGTGFYNGLATRVGSFCHAGDWVCNKPTTSVIPTATSRAIHSNWYGSEPTREMSQAWVGKWMFGRLYKLGLR